MTCGGSRWGAGRPAWRPKAEACLRLDVRELARRKMLSGGNFGWHWSETHSGRWVANIGIEVKGEVVRLDYSVREGLLNCSSSMCRDGTA